MKPNPMIMDKQKQLNIRISEDFYEMAREKCYCKFGIALSCLIKMFLRAFISQRGIGFYVGDDDLCGLFSRWIMKKAMDKGKKRGTHLYGPYLKDIYNLKREFLEEE